MEVELDRVAHTFLRFARGELPGPPSDTPVGVYLGGALLRTVESPELGDRAQWEGLCPDSVGGYAYYAGRTCPFSVLEPLRSTDEGVTTTTEPATHPCAHPTPLTPQQVGGSHRVTLLPKPHGSCPDWVAVELFINDGSQVVAVNLIWAEP
jgi:hypothetical protein